MADAVVGGLRAELTADSAKFTAGLSRARGSVREFENTTRRHMLSVSRVFDGGVRSVAGFASRLLSLRTVVATLAGGAGIGLLIKNAISAADVIVKAADAAGLSTRAYQEISFAAQQTSISQDQLNTALLGFTKRVGEARAGTGTLITGLKATHAQLLENLRSTADQETALNLVIKAIGEQTNAADKALIATAAFGRTGTKFVNLIGEYEDLRNEAQRLGVVLEDDVLRAGVRAGDELQKLGDVITSQLNKAILENIGSITNLATAFTTEFIPAIIRATEEFLKFIGALERTDIEKFERLRDQGRTSSSSPLEPSLEDIFASPSAVQRRLTQNRAAAMLFGPGDAFNPSFGTKSGPAPFRGEQESPLALVPLPGGAKAAGAAFRPVSSRAEAIEAREAAATARMMENLRAATERVRDAQETARAAADDYAAGLKRQGQAITESVLTPTERYREETRELDTLFRSGVITAETYGRAIEQAGERVREASDETERGIDLAKDFGFTMSSAFERAITSGESLRDVLHGLAQDLLQIATRQLVTEPAANLFSDLLGSLIGSSGGSSTGLALATQAGALNTGGFFGAQHGLDFKVPGGFPNDSFRMPLAVSSGERVSVTPNGRGGGGTFIIDARGADRTGLAHLETMIRQINGSVERRAVAAVAGERARNPRLFG